MKWPIPSGDVEKNPWRSALPLPQQAEIRRGGSGLSVPFLALEEEGCAQRANPVSGLGNRTERTRLGGTRRRLPSRLICQCIFAGR